MRPEAPLARALALAAILTLSIPAAQGAVLPGPGEDEPVLVDETVEGGMAVSVTVELTGPALYRIDLIGDGPRSSSAISLGFVEFDQQRSYDGLFAVTTFDSQERQRTVVAGEQVPAPAYEVPDAEGEPLTAVLGDDDTRERACPLACASRLVQPDRSEAGTFHHGVWIGGVNETRLQIVGDENVADVQIEQGTPLNVGSEEFEEGTVNVQHQATTTLGAERAFAGAKAVHEAHHEATVEHDLYGTLGLAEFKTACLGACASVSTVKRSCGLVGADCRAADVAWQGPKDEGAPANSHVFRGNAAGDYVFEVDRLVDAWSTDTPYVANYAYAGPGEHHAFLSAADLPPPPIPR
jgi:hypothetical protein